MTVYSDDNSEMRYFDLLPAEIRYYINKAGSPFSMANTYQLWMRYQSFGISSFIKALEEMPRDRNEAIN